MLGYAKLCYSYAQLCSIMLHIMPIMLDYANYALCSDSAIMPESNAGIDSMLLHHDHAPEIHWEIEDQPPTWDRSQGPK